MKETIGWGMIGTGIIANSFAVSLRELPDGHVAAAAARDIERAQQYCETYGGKAYGSYAEMVQDPDVDIVYVATTHNFHEEHVLMCINAGKHVLCEKPMAVNAAQAERMYADAKEKGVLLVDGLWSRYFPAWEFVTDFIKGGELGKVLSISSTTSWGRDPRHHGLMKNRLYDPELAGGALLDAGVYSLAAVTLTLGVGDYPVTIKSLTEMSEHGVDERDIIALDYNGVLCNLTCGISGYLQETRIFLEGGTVTIPQHRNPSKVIISGRQRVNDWRSTVTKEYYFPYDTEGFQYEAAHVHDCLRKGLKTSPRVTPEESLMLLRICDEVRKQADFKYPFE